MRKMQNFEYLKPRTLDELFSLMDRYEESSRILAGGTDLLVALKKRSCPKPRRVINIKGIPHLDIVEFDEKENELKIGALVSIHALLKNPLIKSQWGVLHQAAEVMASPQVKNMATIGGNLCNGSPAADLPPPLMVLSATISVAGPDGERIVPIEDFFVGPGKTVLAKNEIVTAVRIPLPITQAACRYVKFSPGRPSDLALVGVAVLVKENSSGVCTNVRIALGAVAEKPIRALRAEKFLIGRDVNEEVFTTAGTIASEEARPIDDLRGSAWYRLEMIKTLVARTLKVVHKECEKLNSTKGGTS